MKPISHKTPFAASLCYAFAIGWLVVAGYCFVTSSQFIAGSQLAAGISLTAAGISLAAAIGCYLGGRVIGLLVRQVETATATHETLAALLAETRKLTSIQRQQADRSELKDIAERVRISDAVRATSG
jgi:hypothetical protein